MSLDVQISSDVICPWCYVGKRLLERFLATARRADVCSRFNSTHRYLRRA
jgi:predicted DsbA family dithiol-disulfide isomerase